MRSPALSAVTSLLLLIGCGGESDPAPDAGDDPDGPIDIDGLTAPVDAFFDEGGVLHLRCQTDADCFAAQGYFHAAHRFFQMDLRRRLGRGRISELVGPLAIPTDLEYRRLLSTRDGAFIGDQLWASASPETREAIEAYTRGVNAWLADFRAGQHGATVADEYSFVLIQEAFADWEAMDTVASFLPIMTQLTMSGGRDIAAGNAFAALGPEVAADLFGVTPASPSAILPIAGDGGDDDDRDALRQAHRRLAAHRDLLAGHSSVLGPPRPPGSTGSNNWIVGPAMADGATLLANDPHLPLSNPAIWYLVNMESTGGSLHLAGASFPGLPGVLFGQSQDIAWGVTTTLMDQSDVYVETLSADRTAVLTADGEVAIATVTHDFLLPDGTSETRIVEIVPHHGPILSIDDEAGTALSLRWAAQDADTDLNVVLDLAHARTVAEAREALRQVTAMGQNFVVIDRAGSMGWFPYNRVPTRPWAAATPPWLPLPGDGSAEWGDYISYDDLPQSVDPPAGFLATANNDMTGALADGDASDSLQGLTAMGFRHERIVERLAARDHHDLASMQDIQADVHSLVGERMVPAILDAVSAAPLTPPARKVVDALAAWDFDCPTGLSGTSSQSAPVSGDQATASIGCTAFHALWGELMSGIFGDEIAAAGLAEPGTPYFYLPSPLVLAFARPNALDNAYWDDVSTPAAESRAATVAAALDRAGVRLESEIDPSPDTWRWGRVHTVTPRADLFDAVGVADYNGGTYANDGGIDTVDVAEPLDPATDLSHAHGASLRLCCRADADAIACTYQLPGGQRHFRGDPHYDNLLGRWLVNQPTPLIFDLAAAQAAAVESLTLVPASGS